RRHRVQTVPRPFALDYRRAGVEGGRRLRPGAGRCARPSDRHRGRVREGGGVDMRPLLLRLLPVISAALLSATGFLPACAGDGDGQPTVGLVHGAWAGTSSWSADVGLLRAEGYRTVTPTLGLTSLNGDVAIVSAALDQIRGKKILVAHSYGGAVISSASA